MYYLILKDLTNDIKIIGNCETSPHKSVIIKNYCLNNDIHLVSSREDINTQCSGVDQIYAYPILNNQYIILKCTRHAKNLVFNTYVEKYNIGFLEFHYYTPKELQLRKIEIEETLICDVMTKLEKEDYECSKTLKKRYI